MLDLDTLDKDIFECEKRAQDEGGCESTLEMLLKIRDDLKTATEEEWSAYNELVEHLPNENEDPILIILKGQLLIERKVRKFINSRLPNPDALQKQTFSAAQCIAIAESMCLYQEEPVWLWKQIKELNAIRNKLAHTLNDENIDKRINSFVSTVNNVQKLNSKSIVGAIARLYGMLKGLFEISESDEFKLYK
ncbi:hypothetical protein [Francisella philomiragia]|uniref:hypothetical protein n=1 Tax=Francisella philomiragia TaxID=28110 RepID=UPI001902FC83|nr:hypothetical protein [Francisella philomiragia]MBK2094025.1 hypothetical protein [Francisella philomiragia]MBK2256496.1 hypothetical protein [Francisella philomiragia]MBK2269154.1 hypothetical protein [Francisella philomiragia]MBK2270372.1 hypothetical protein [Francisella philomiragia]MBK2274151.1 hypothetical protein [Francisella philomiragia]